MRASSAASSAAIIWAIACAAMIGCSSSDFAVAGADDDSGASPDTESPLDAKGDVGDGVANLDAGPEASTEAATDAAADSALPAVMGCSDLTREYLNDVTKFPGVAGCSGGFTLPGLGPDLAGSGCAHVAGNDSSNVDGKGCHASDLCAVGWHLCADNVEFQLKSGVSKCPLVNLPRTFFASAQRSSSSGVCPSAPLVTDANDIFGCGSFGDTTGSCGPFDRYLSTFTTDTASWVVGGDANRERDHVVKGPLDGGVLCCSP